jgi:hypothetical protein
LENEIGGSIGIHHAGANDSESTDWRNGCVIVGVRDGEHPISFESCLCHVSVAFLKDIQRQKSAWKKGDPREDHDIRLVWQIVYIIAVHCKWLRVAVLQGCEKS